MKTIVKYAAMAVLTGAMALAVSTPSQARHGRNGALIGGFVAGAVVGAAVANSANGYYYNDPGYAYGPGPGYVDDGAYAYEPERTYQYRRGAPSCAIDQGYGRYDYTGC